MRIFHFNGSDSEGGTSKAALRLLHGLHDEGAETALYVQRKSGCDPLVAGPDSLFAKALGRTRPSMEETLLGIPPRKVQGPFCAAWLPDGLLRRAAGFAPDIIHLHWVARMMRLETLARFRVPLVWTLHDSWPFTGGCYLPLDCTRYRESCGDCPVLGSSRQEDLSRKVWSRKKAAWRGLDLTLIAPSRWMAQRARESSLFSTARIEVIPNGLDTGRYQPVDKRAARESLSLPQGKKLLLFGARGGTGDPNKGFHLLREALRDLAGGPLRDSIELVIFGATLPQEPLELGFKAHYLGWLGDDASLARLYGAADLFVFPSIQESLGYTAMEAMACGTPCVAFRQGGVPDLIDHEENGYLARPYQAADLARGIAWVLEGAERGKELSNAARTKIVQEFALDRVARRHLALYREILGRGDDNKTECF
jgi:glycosyltransferase involved in cell wall biosynthesis